MPFLIYGLVALVGAGAGWAAKDVTTPETVNTYNGTGSQDQRPGMSPLMIAGIVVAVGAGAYYLAKKKAA